MARWKIANTDAPVGEIALECGFYDQSHFTRTFSRAMGLNPLAYRRNEAAASRP